MIGRYLKKAIIAQLNAMKNALTIDLEDWYHPELVRKYVHGIPKSQISDSANQIIRLLDKYDVKATFFILGDVATKNPKLIKMIHDKGHEISSHGMSHLPLWNLDYDRFSKELKTFKRIVKSILGENAEIHGFRAPTFSLDHTTNYGIRCLIDNYFQYDSSIFPAKTRLYGIDNAPCSIYRVSQSNLCVEDDSSKIIEFPLTVFRMGRTRIPVSGGFYLRVIPYFVLKVLLKSINKKRPFVIYFHPWETFPKTPRIKEIGFKNYIITYYGIDNCLGKIEKILRDFEFEPMRNVIDREMKAPATDMPVREYFEKCSDRFNGYYREEKRNFFQKLIHDTLRKPGLVQRFEITIDALGNVKNKTILDVGCGSAIYSIYLAKKGANVTGVDFSPNMIGLAERNAKEEKCEIDLIITDFLTYEEKSSFDYSLFIGFFDYVKKDDIPKFFEKATSLTNRKIIATFPKKFAFQTIIRYIWLKRQNCPVHFYTREQIRKIAKKFNLRENFHDCGPIWTVEFAKKSQ